jgi:hypothetical protein
MHIQCCSKCAGAGEGVQSAELIPASLPLEEEELIKVL